MVRGDGAAVQPAQNDPWGIRRIVALLRGFSEASALVARIFIRVNVPFQTVDIVLM